MLLTASILLIAIAFGYPLLVRRRDLPEPEPLPPTFHLEERKAAIYENLRDLQTEYRMGKLSDDDYQAAKRDLQHELAELLARLERETGAAQ